MAPFRPSVRTTTTTTTHYSGHSFLIGLVTALGLASAAATSYADETTGIPEPSIATSLPPELADPGGIRRDLAARGVTFGVNYIGEYFSDVSGGLNRGNHYDGRLELYVDANLEKMIGWKGLAFHANGYQIHGSGISAETVGSLMPVSFIEADPTTRLFELYLEQSLLDGGVTIRAGQLAADSEFLISDGAAAFINGTWGWPSIAATDIPQGGPAYPLATPGVRVSISPGEDDGLMVGVFSGEVASNCAPDQDPQKCNPYGLDFPIGDGVFVMAEGFHKYKAGALPGRIKLGGWFHSGDFEKLASPAIVDSGNYGLYAIWDQTLANLDNNGRNIAIFARLAGAPDDRNEIDFYAEAGITVTGPLACRPNDLLGIGFAYTGISDGAQQADVNEGLPVIRDYESLLEVSYTATVVPGFSIQPDLQYFWNPGAGVPDSSGTRPVENALVIGLRSTLNY